MIGALTLLLACQLAGEIFARSTSVPVPGPVVGFALLTAILWVGAARRGDTPDAVEKTPVGQVARALLANLGLLFVPAGVGIVQQLDVLRASGVAIGIAIVVSTVLTLVVTVAAFRFAKRPFA